MKHVVSGIAVAGLLWGCSRAPNRLAEVAQVMSDADEPLARTRPTLLAGKYQKMAADEFDYYRGSLAVYAHDWRQGGFPVAASRFAVPLPLVRGLVDPHPENFGTLRASDGSYALEPNDFDSADAVPYLWDVRRLTTGLVLFARLSSPSHPEANQAARGAERDIARAAAQGYAAALLARASGAAPVRYTADASPSAAVRDLLQKAQRDGAARQELGDLTVLDANGRHLRRGVYDPAAPLNVLASLPEEAMAALPAALLAYPASLPVALPAADVAVLDAVQEFGSGTASWPRLRLLVLLRGPTDAPEDDEIVELKEMIDPGLAAWTQPAVVADSVQARVQTATRLAWARPDADPRWGTSTWLGLPVQLKSESAGFKTVKVEKLQGALGTPRALSDLASELGALLARVHAATPDPAALPAVAAALRADPDGFADEQADAAVAYADRVDGDWALFQQALAALGPTLGQAPGPEDGLPSGFETMFEAPDAGPSP